jgi:ATP-dependent Clp protease ATP-binding subunit ClpB
VLDNVAKRFLAQEGYDPQFGARPLKRTIQEQLLDPLAMKLLDGEFKPGDNIRVTAADNELIFQNGEHTSSKSSSS